MELVGFKEFLDFRTELLEYLESVVPKWPTEPLASYFRDLIEYVIEGSDFLCAKFVLVSFFAVSGVDPSSSTAKWAYALAWSQELLYGAWIVMDDLIDDEEIRRGKATWHKKGNNGYSAVSDAYFLENIPMHVVRHFCTGMSADVLRTLLWTFDESTLLTAIGQFLDSTLNGFVMRDWERLADSRIGVCRIWQPIVCGLCAGGLGIEVTKSQKLKDLLLMAGRVHQCSKDWIRKNEDLHKKRLNWILCAIIEKNPELGERLLEGGEKELEKVVGDLEIEENWREYRENGVQKVRDGLKEIEMAIPEQLVEFLISVVH
jgi:hypothetical protein